ncbi:partner and localizer of BRCA2 [Phaethornis superciliosus]
MERDGALPPMVAPLPWTRKARAPCASGRERGGREREGRGGMEEAAGTGTGTGTGAGAGALSGAEKEKLREKLALLRREYSQTVSRLRRARRAERARSHGRGGEARGDRRQPSPAEDGDSAVLDTSGGGREASSGVMEQGEGKSVCEDEEDLHRLLDFMSENEVLPADGNNTQTNTGSGGNQSDTNPSPTDLAVGNAEELLENQELETPSSPSPAEGGTAPGSSLNSCTVVEGLLFPLEYYVRTTRRMSSCQRKVDLDAVILSQLGRGKKGQRSKGRQRAAHSEHPSQERVGNDLESGAMLLPSGGAENDPGSSGGPQTSAPASSGSSTSLGSLSQNSITSTKPDQGRLQRKAKGRRSSCRAPAPRLPPGAALQLLTPRDGSHLSQEGQGEGKNSEPPLGKPSSPERRLSAAGEAEVTCTTQLASADPAPKGSQVLSKHSTTLTEQLQNPLQSCHSLTPGNETSAGRVGDLEANSPVCQADDHPLEPLRNQPLHGGCGAEQPPAPGIPLRRSLRCSGRQRGSPAPTDESKGGHSQAAGGGPAPLSPPALHPHASASLLSFRSLQYLIPRLGIRDFHLPNEEFGPLKLEKLVSSPVNDLEVFVPNVFGGGVASEGTAGTGMNPEEKRITSSLSLPSKNRRPKLPHGESPASKRELSTHELLFTPMGSVSAGAPTQPESQVSSSIFPVVGATPAGLPSGHSQVCPDTLPVPPSQLSLRPSKEISAQAMDGGECKAPALPLLWDTCGAESARKEEKQSATFPLESERGPDNKPAEGVDLEKHQQSESTEQRPCRAAPDQKTDVAEQLTPPDGLREESLQLVSKLKDSSGSCAVDVSTMWWEAAGSRELCVVLACESSVSLWKPLESNQWEKLHTWQLGEIPVIQIIPLPDTCNLVCIALGELEIEEIRLLLYSSEGDSFKQSLVKAGNIKAVLGLQERRLVSSSRTGQEQQVEMVSLAETGRSKDGQTLMPPEETVLSFAEVEGMREALVGSTAGNCIVVWNLRTGQLLKRMQIGYSYPASICHRAYPQAGLLFVVLSHPHAEENEPSGTPAFCLMAFNPKTALSTGVMFSSLPPGQAGRYLEGEVRDTSALALLSSGAIALWDLLGGHCTVLLPPEPPGRWALARWADTGTDTGTCLLAGQRDGTVCLYRYRYQHPEPGAA